MSEQTDRDVPEEYRMEGGDRPEAIRRRNLVTGIVLLVAIATIVAITVYSRATGESSTYGLEDSFSPHAPTLEQQQKPAEKSAPPAPSQRD